MLVDPMGIGPRGEAQPNAGTDFIIASRRAATLTSTLSEGCARTKSEPRVYSDLPIMRRDDSWRFGSVVYNVCVKHDLQVLAVPVLGCVFYELPD